MTTKGKNSKDGATSLNKKDIEKKKMMDDFELAIAKSMTQTKLDQRQQLMVVTMEECGELIHACSKALRRGELYENSDSQLKLKQEVGDVYAMIDLLVEWDVLSWDEIEEQRNKKREKLKKWSDLI